MANKCEARNAQLETMTEMYRTMMPHVLSRNALIVILLVLGGRGSTGNHSAAAHQDPGCAGLSGGECDHSA
jgi:hypothetical protein